MAIENALHEHVKEGPLTLMLFIFSLPERAT
jgi:hypothetical protein